MLVPITQVADESRFCRMVQRSQWLIEKQGARFGHQSARQGDALAFTSGDLRRTPVAQMIDAEGVEHLAAALFSLKRAQRAETVSDVLLGGQVRKSARS